MFINKQSVNINVQPKIHKISIEATSSSTEGDRHLTRKKAQEGIEYQVITSISRGTHGSLKPESL